MIGNQRWELGRDRYRPPAETIRTSEYEIAEIPGDKEAKAFVELHHYSRSFPAARLRYGLHRRGQLVGVAVFSVPPRPEVLTNVFPVDPLEAVELGRFVLLDEVPGNGETWFLGRCFEALRREGMRGVVSFSDPVPRQDAAGRTVFPGHLGTIYQAHNGVYLGRGTARTLRLLPDGTVFSDRTAQKIRARERGWEHAARQLVAFGARPLEEEEGAEWLRTWLPRLTRRLRHPGNHKYAWALDRKMRAKIPGGQAYPKRTG